MHWHWQRFHDFTIDELYETLQLRAEVFVVEQTSIYQDIDDLDKCAWHLSARNDDNELIAYLRVVDPGKKYTEPSIGRVVTAKKFRGDGLGQILMQTAIDNTTAAFPQQGIRISAQLYLEKFYRELGFNTVSDEYSEDGIPHIEMLRE